MDIRKLKQIIYGALYLSLLMAPLLIFIASAQPASTCFDNRKNQNETDVDCGGSCTPCLIKHITEIQVLWQKHFLINPSQIGIAAKLRNPNVQAGAVALTYDIDVLGPFGVKVQTIERQSYILPGETKYIVEGISNVNAQEINGVVLTLKDIEWKPAELIKRPMLSTNSVTGRIGSDQFIEVSGHVINEDAVRLARVRVKAILYDKNGEIAVPLQTEVNNLTPKEERAFRIAVATAPSVLRSLDLGRIDVETEVVSDEHEVSF